MFLVHVLQRPVSECLVPCVGDQCPGRADHLWLLFWAWNNKQVTHKPDMCLFMCECVFDSHLQMWPGEANVSHQRDILEAGWNSSCVKCPHFLHWWEFSGQHLLEYLWNWSLKRSVYLLNAASVINEFTLNIIKKTLYIRKLRSKITITL